MAAMNDLLNRLKARNADVESRDDDLRDELEEKRGIEGVAPELELRDLGDDVNLEDLARETIVMRTGRPVLAVLRNQAELTFSDPDSMVWKSRLENAAPPLVNAARAVGRIEVEGHSLAWLGTGWLVAPGVVVTNRHVAAEFGRQDGARFVFRQGLTGQPMTASIDFLEEVGSPEELTFALERVLYIEGPDGPDLAFLRVSANGSGWPSPIALAASAANDELVAVIGYPARDSRIPVRPHGRVTERRRHRVARAIAESNRAVSDVAREYQVSWPTAHKALVSAAATWPPEPEPTTRLGIDETRFRSVRWILDGITWKRSNPWLTAFVDCSRDGPGSLLGLAPGRTGAGVREWLASSPKRSASGSRSW
jgi:hypothetical protein